MVEVRGSNVLDPADSAESCVLRRSRRIAGLPVDPADMAPPRNGENSSPVVVNGWHHKEPRSFSGNDDDDVEDWLKHYERVSKYNRWDTAAQLAYVVVYLVETALTWFENNEAKLTTWASFVEELRKSFGDPISRRKKAEQTLAQRAQVPGETCTAYIQEVLKLCSLVNPNMTEEDKVGHLLKGIAEDVYHFLIAKENLASAADVASYCRTFEALKLRRICPKFGRLPNVPTVASVDTGPSEDIASLVRRIIREELGYQVQAYTAGPPAYSGPPANCVFHQCAVHEPCLQVPAPRPQLRYTEPCGTFPQDGVNVQSFRAPSRRLGYENESRRVVAGYPRQQVEPARYRQQGDQDRYREPPVCYFCGVSGHIARFCRRRQQQAPRLFAPSSPSRRDGAIHQDPLFHYPAPLTNRNASPAVSDRSITPPLRQGRSPSPRRRSVPPPLGN